MSFQNLSRELDIIAAPFLARLINVYTLTAEDVSSLGDYFGMEAGTNLYSFIEQTYSPTTGLTVDATPGRRTILSAATGKPTSCFAVESNNQLVSVQGSLYVQMRLRGTAGSGVLAASPCYEFSAQTPLAYVQPTTTSPSEITLGRTITDAILNGTDVLESPQEANFTIKDEGAVLVGAGIPGGTTILSVTSATTVVMSASATTSARGVTVAIETGSVKGYAAVVNYIDPVYGSWKRRTITDVSLTNTSPTLTSTVQGIFTLGDDGATLTGNGIPANTTATFFNATTLTMSNAANHDETNDTVVIQQGALQVAWLVLSGDSVYLDVGLNPQPVLIPVSKVENYQARYFQADVGGMFIFVVDDPQVAVVAVLNSGTPNSAGLFDATIQTYDPATETWTSGPSIWLRDANA